MWITGAKEVLEIYCNDLQSFVEAKSNHYIGAKYSSVIEIEGEYYTLYKPEWVEKPENTEIINVLPQIEEENDD